MRTTEDSVELNVIDISTHSLDMDNMDTIHTIHGIADLQTTDTDMVTVGAIMVMDITRFQTAMDMDTVTVVEVDMEQIAFHGTLTLEVTTITSTVLQILETTALMDQEQMVL